MMTGRRASRRYRLATESNAVDGVGALKVTTQEAVGSIKMISSTIGKISEITTAISAAIEQQGAATQEISDNIQRTADGTMQVAGKSAMAPTRPARHRASYCHRQNNCRTRPPACRRRSTGS